MKYLSIHCIISCNLRLISNSNFSTDCKLMKTLILLTIPQFLQPPSYTGERRTETFLYLKYSCTEQFVKIVSNLSPVQDYTTSGGFAPDRGSLADEIDVTGLLVDARSTLPTSPPSLDTALPTLVKSLVLRSYF